MNEIIYKCQNCKDILFLEKEPCPKCGCEKRDIFKTIAENVSVHEQLRGKVKNVPGKKPKLKFEFKKGDDFCKKTGQWNDLERIFDRSKNPEMYKEIIKDADGKIIKQVEEPLPNHQGHGSAKYKKVKKIS